VKKDREEISWSVQQQGTCGRSLAVIRTLEKKRQKRSRTEKAGNKGLGMDNAKDSVNREKKKVTQERVEF